MFYDKYEALCKERGEKPYSVLKKIGIQSSSIVAQWQKGSVPRRMTLEKLADYFGVSVSYLMDLDEGTKKADPSGAGLSEIKRRAIKMIETMTDEECEKLVQFLEMAKK